MRWQVKIDGQDDELKELSQILEKSKIQIVKEGDSYFIVSHQWDSITDCEEVRNSAKYFIAEINGIAKLLLALDHPIKSEFDEIIKFDEKGNRKEIIRKCLEIKVTPTIPLIFQDNVKEVRLDPAVFFPNYVDLAMKHDHVQYVTRMVDYGFDIWYSLFCILEAIESDMGGYKKIRWMNLTERKRFRATVQDRRIIDLYARHGDIEEGGPIANPMSLEEARSFIWNTVIKWLNGKNPLF